MNIGPTGGGGSAHLPQQVKSQSAPTTEAKAGAQSPAKADDVANAKAAEPTAESQPVSNDGRTGSVINTLA